VRLTDEDLSRIMKDNLETSRNRKLAQDELNAMKAAEVAF
jgi:hypothetical protein